MDQTRSPRLRVTRMERGRKNRRMKTGRINKIIPAILLFVCALGATSVPASADKFSKPKSTSIHGGGGGKGKSGTTEKKQGSQPLTSVSPDFEKLPTFVKSDQ